MSRFVPVCDEGELSEGEAKVLQPDHRPICVFHVQGQYLAIEELCPHRGGPLSEGKLEGAVVTCPWHNARFDLKTGKALSGPVSRDLRRYATRVENGKVEVEVP